MQRQGTEPVRVVVQARPVLRHETANNDASTVRISTDPPLITVTDGKRDPKIFDQFDGVYNGAPETIFRLFESHVAPLVAGAFQGVNATTLAYGQTAAGKTFTIDAILEEIGRDVFRRANDINTNTDSRVIITCSVIEVYQDSFRDLLRRPGNVSIPIEIHETNPGNRNRKKAKSRVYLTGVKEERVHDEADLAGILELTKRRRITATTKMNNRSSRSHSIVTLTLDIRNAHHERLIAKLNIVDLAGSERTSRTGAQGLTLKQGIQINTSLLALTNVIGALSKNADLVKKGKPLVYVPYRDSKLTRFLKDSLGGAARTLLIACVAPTISCRQETLSTLHFAVQAKSIDNVLEIYRATAERKSTDLKAALQVALTQVSRLRDENQSLLARVRVLEDQLRCAPASRARAVFCVPTARLAVSRESDKSASAAQLPYQSTSSTDPANEKHTRDLPLNQQYADGAKSFIKYAKITIFVQLVRFLNTDLPGCWVSPIP